MLLPMISTMGLIVDPCRVRAIPAIEADNNNFDRVSLSATARRIGTCDRNAPLASFLEVKIRQPCAIQQHDLPLGLAEEA